MKQQQKLLEFLNFMGCYNKASCIHLYLKSLGYQLSNSVTCDVLVLFEALTLYGTNMYCIFDHLLCTTIGISLPIYSKNFFFATAY